jgi:HEAT repeat protein
MFGPKPLPRTLRAAERDIGDKKLDVRLSAVRDLARLASGPERREVVVALARALEDASPAVRAEAAVSLADADARDCLGALVAASEDAHVRVRQMVTLALGELAGPNDREARRAIERALGSDAPEVRYQALIAMYHVTDAAAVPRIVDKLSDADGLVRHIAYRLLEEHAFESAEPRALPSDVLARAEKALADASPAVRLAAAIVLAKSGNAAGHAPIVEVVNARKPGVEKDDELAAVELAGELGLEAARPGLERRAWRLTRLGRQRFTWQARVALARLGDARAKESILRGLAAWTRDARTLAVAAAGRARLAEARPLLLEMRGDELRADPHAVREALDEIER